MTSRTLVSLCLLAAALTACSEAHVFTPPAVDLPMRNLQVTPEPREGMARGANVSFSLSFTSGVRRAHDAVRARPDGRGAAHVGAVGRSWSRGWRRRWRCGSPSRPTASSVDVIATYHAGGEAKPFDIHFPYTTR